MLEVWLLSVLSCSLKGAAVLGHSACWGQSEWHVPGRAHAMSIPLCVAGTAWWPCLSRALPGSSRAGLGSCRMDLLLISLQKVRGFFCSLVWGLVVFGVCCRCLCSWQNASKVLLGAGGWAGFGLSQWQIFPCPLWLFCSDLCKLMERTVSCKSHKYGVQIYFPVFWKQGEQTMSIPAIHS